MMRLSSLLGGLMMPDVIDTWAVGLFWKYINDKGIMLTDEQAKIYLTFYLEGYKQGQFYD